MSACSWWKHDRLQLPFAALLLIKKILPPFPGFQHVVPSSLDGGTGKTFYPGYVVTWPVCSSACHIAQYKNLMQGTKCSSLALLVQRSLLDLILMQGSTWHWTSLTSFNILYRSEQYWTFAIRGRWQPNKGSFHSCRWRSLHPALIQNFETVILISVRKTNREI